MFTWAYNFKINKIFLRKIFHKIHKMLKPPYECKFPMSLVRKKSFRSVLIKKYTCNFIHIIVVLTEVK